MTTSNILAVISACLALTIIMGAAYIYLPWTKRKVERLIKAWMSPATLVLYLLIVINGFVAALGY